MLKLKQLFKQNDVFQQRMEFYKKYILPTKETSSYIKKCQRQAYGYLILNKSFFFGAPLCVGGGINMLSNAESIIYAPYYFIGYGTCYTAYVFFEGKRNQKLQEINQIAMNDMALITYEHLLKLDGEYHLSQSTSKTLISIYKAQKAIDSNLRSLNQYFLPLTADIIGSSLLISIHFGMPYVSTFLVTFCAYAAFTLKYSNFRKKLIFEQKRCEREADNTISQALNNLFTVRYFNAEKYELQRYSEILAKVKNQSIRIIQTLSTLNAIQRFILSSGMTVNLLLAVQGVKNGLMRAGDMVLIQSLMIQLFQPLFMLGVMHREWSESAIDIKELFSILNSTPKIQEDPNAFDFKYKQGDIEFKDVCFEYPNNPKPILKNFNLKINGGDWILVTGESGVGKSTLINLIFRLLECKVGNIYLDDQDIRQLKFNSFRKYFGVVSQQSYFFNESIRNNLLYGLDVVHNLNPQEVQDIEIKMKEYCRQLGLDKVIEQLPQQYETMVGEQANKFSGGEKQRMQIVRCLLRGAKILLLDEPTSALDSQNENQLIQTLEQFLKTQDLTVLIISHRLNLHKVADKVLCLGKDAYEFDTHENLLKEGTIYQNIWQQYNQN